MFKTGDRVKLNIGAIKNQLYYPDGMSPVYVDFVESSKGTVFTVAEYDPSGMYVLRYKDAVIDWVFWAKQLVKAGSDKIGG